MNTEILDAINFEDSSIKQALDWLRNGYPVAFPTETVYGIGAGIYDTYAVEKVFKIKGRDFRNPLSAHISRLEDALELCLDIPDEFYMIAEKFLPGPISIVMKKKNSVPDIVTGGGNTISIRYPDNNVFLKMAGLFVQPIAATSANRSGRPSPTSAADVFDDLTGLIPAIIDTGTCKYQIESTVISLADKKVELIRPGAIPQSAIKAVIGKEILSRNRQIILKEDYKSSLNATKLNIECFDNLEKIYEFANLNTNKKILIMAFDTSIINSSCDITKTDELTFFSTLRKAEKESYDFLLVLVDDYVRSSEVLSHRLRIS
ncbi:hypothetical protein MASR1M45_12810 [Candidatus Kapaibacterium sp.]